MALNSIPDNLHVYSESGTGTATLEALESAQEYNRWVVDFFRPYLGATNFELGAGQGTLTAIVAETHAVTPFEISPANISALRERLASHPRVVPCRSDILECKDFDCADCVYSANVLEHIENDVSIIQHCAKLLRVGGWFLAFVPAGQWLYSKMDRELGHFRRYTAKDKFRLSQSPNDGARLKLREFRFVNLPGAFGWFAKMRVLGSTRISSDDAAIVGRLIPLIRALDKLRLPIGQSAVMAWQRIV
jgi:SAM-dependent methyltransferase